MILFSSVKLEQKLAADALTSWEKAKYIIFVIILYNFSIPIYVLMPSFGPKSPLAYDIVAMLSSMLIIFITYFGIKKCYKINKCIDDSDFIDRFVTLFVPITMKFVLIFIPIFIIIFSVAYTITINNEIRQSIFLYCMRLISPITTYLFYIFLSRSFRRLRKQKTEWELIRDTSHIS